MGNKNSMTVVVMYFTQTAVLHISKMTLYSIKCNKNSNKPENPFQNYDLAKHLLEIQKSDRKPEILWVK